MRAFSFKRPVAVRFGPASPDRLGCGARRRKNTYSRGCGPSGKRSQQAEIFSRLSLKFPQFKRCELKTRMGVVSAETSQYTHAFCLNCNKVRPVRFIRAARDERAPTDVICSQCNFIIASLYT